MDRNSLKAIEFYGFMALAAWLVYSQLSPARPDRNHAEGSPSDEVQRESDEPTDS